MHISFTISKLKLVVLLFLLFPLIQFVSSQNNTKTKLNSRKDSPYIDSLLKSAREIPENRTLFSRKFISHDGKIIMQFSSQPLSYKNSEGKLEPVKISLKPSGNGWIAKEQMHPCMLNEDMSTTIALYHGSQLKFNGSVCINTTACEQKLTSVDQTSATVKISNDIIKKITFGNGMIETDYTLLRPLDKGCFSVSEEIEFPTGHRFIPDTKKGKIIQGTWYGDYVLLSGDNEEEARFHIPVCYDAKGKSCNASYQVITKDGKHSLITSIPSGWLKNASYPVVMDPLVAGPETFWLGGNTNSCQFPNYYSDSILVYKPGGITTTGLFVSTNYTTVWPLPKKAGSFYLSTSCSKTQILSCDTSVLPGECEMDDYNLVSLACCYKPSCSPDSFYLVQHLTRKTVGTGCSSDSVYCSAVSFFPFSAFIIGETDTCIWTVSPTTVCSNSCELTLRAICHSGVPPYIISHPWASAKVSGGVASSGCSAAANLTLNLILPGCPSYCGSSDTIIVPPPLVIDACGDTVKTLASKKIMVNPSPKINTLPDSLTLCTGGTPVIFAISSCTPGTTINWIGTDKISGTGNINDPVKDTTENPLHLTYMVTALFNGCRGDTLIIPATINPYPIITISKSDTIISGRSASITASGGTTYSWTPESGLNCATCPDPVASPTVTTTYSVTVTGKGGCSSSDTTTVYVISSNLVIPNVISPNGDGINDDFAIKNLSYFPGSKLTIYDRWGIAIYESDNYKNDWNGNGAPDGTYYYTLNATDQGKIYHGFLTLIR
jgi:gliding motility-associated-like protein